jgi:hypothetical protein
MFRTPKVKSYLQSVKFQGKEDNPLLQLTFYITPIPYELATEVSPRMADRLFRKGIDDKWAPSQELGSTRFTLGTIPMQSMEWHPAGEGTMEFDAGVMTQGVSINAIGALRLFADSPDITLAIVCELPLDSLVVELARKYYRKNVFLTMADMQAELFVSTENMPPGDAKCLECGEPASWIDTEKDFFCGDHVRKARGTVTKIVPMETPAQAEARALAAAAGQSPAATAEQKKHIDTVIAQVVDAPADDRKDTSHINRRRTKGKKK